jgi:anti-sigma factor RsiW
MSDHPHEDELHAYIDGQLDPAEETRIEAWLAAHPGERSRIDSYRRHKALLKSALIEGVEAPTGELPLRRARRPHRSPAWQRLADLPLTKIAAGLTLFVLGAFSHFGWQSYGEWRVPATLETATKAHQVFSAERQRPVEIPGSRRAEMARWFERHLGTAVEIPDLNSLALRLVGGRLLASTEGPMAQLLYEDRQGNRLTLYLTVEESDVGSEVEVVKVADFSAGFWQDGELTYTIVADMEAEALLALAAEVSGTTDFPQL